MQVILYMIVDEAARGVLGELDSIDEDRVAVYLCAIVTVDPFVGEAPNEATIRLLHCIYVARAETVFCSHIFIYLSIG